MSKIRVLALLVGYLLLAVFGSYLIYKHFRPEKEENCFLELFDSNNHGVYFPVSDCMGLESQCNLLNPTLEPCLQNMTSNGIWKCYSGHMQMNCTWYEKGLCECQI